MPQFSYTATDSLGTKVEGTVEAGDLSSAIAAVEHIGYLPIQVGRYDGSTGTAGTDAAATGIENRPLRSDLTQPMAPVSTDATTVGAEVQQGRLEPWQRGGPLPTYGPPAAAQVTTAAAPPALLQETEHNAQVLPIIADRPPVQPGGFAELCKEKLWYPLISGVVVKDLAVFYRQLATLINAGIPLSSALGTMVSNTKNVRLREIAHRAELATQSGGRLSDVMAQYPWVFAPMQIGLVRAAEQGGMLHETLLQIAGYVEKELDLRRSIKKEAFYPLLVLFMAVMILGRPGFFHLQPALSNLVLGEMGKSPYTFVDYFLDTAGFALLFMVPLLLTVALFRLFLFNAPGVSEAYDNVKLRLPVLGGLARMFAVARFSRTLSALYRGGFSMSGALPVAGDAAGNAVLSHAAREAARASEHGGLVSDSLRSSGILPQMALDMVRTGETTGNLDAMLDKVADYYESEAISKAHMTAIIFGVLLFLAVAALVAMALVGQWTSYGESETTVPP